MGSYLIPAHPVKAEYRVKKSLFLCYIDNCQQRADAESFIRKVRSEHPDANHNCWAFVAGQPDDPSGYGMSDDGEPKGCAGKPMFNVLHHSGIGEICAVVSRYFGGIKLGTGGMARAYSTAVQLGLAELETTTRVHYTRLRLIFPYNLQQTVERLLQDEQAIIASVEYGADIILQADIDQHRIEGLLMKLAGLNHLGLRSENI